MAKKYTPLDLSFLQNQYSQQADSIRNTAAMIMANAGWSQPSQVTLSDIAKAQQKAQQEYNSAHKQTFLSSVIDLLSTPLYGAANALDEALAGHQSDSNDSVLEDIAKTAGGVGTGLVRGLGAGLRGASGILDALPGVDINDEWQSDREDKTHFSDVAIRKTTGMSTADAMKPENWEKVKSILEEANQKSTWDKTFFELAIPDNLDDPKAREEYFRNQMLTGIPVDIGADPLNLVFFGGGAANRAAKSTEGITEGLEAARSMAPTADAISKGLNVKAADTFPVKPGLNAPPPIASIDEVVSPGTSVPIASVNALGRAGSNATPSPAPPVPHSPGTATIVTDKAWDVASRLFARNQPFEAILRADHNLSPETIAEIDRHLRAGTTPIIRHSSQSAPPAPVAPVANNVPEVSATSFDKGGFKQLSNIGRREDVPKQGFEVPVQAQQKLVKEISTLAGTGQKGWLYKAADMLRRYPKVNWTETEKFLQRADKAVRSRNARHNPARMAPVLAEKIAQDVRAARPTGDVERRIANTLTDVVIRPGAPRLKASEARLANQVVRKFENEILGRGRAPGTGEGLARAIAGGANVRYSGPQQARMWNQITSNLKYGNASKFDKAVRILRAVEDYFITKGMIPHSAAKTAESVPLRLSQVAEAIGPQFLGKTHAFITGILRGDPKALAQLTPEQINALQALRASEAFASAPAVQRGIQAGKAAIDDVAKMSLSAGRKKPLLNEATKIAKLRTAQFGGGDAGAHVVGKYVGNLIGKSDPINAALSANRLKTEAWLAKVGRPGVRHFFVNDPEFLRSVNNAISRAANLPSPAQLSGVSGIAARVTDWLGARFNAAYGVQDMRPIFLREQASAMSTTGRRAKLLNDLGRRFPPTDKDLWHEAFRAAQQNGISSGRVAELQSEIAKVMENLFGGSGLRAGAIADSTIIGRNRLLLDELNKNLKRFGLSEFQFQAKKVKDADGVVHDFSKGLDWMKSWEAWNVKNPYEFLHRVQNAIEFTVREKNMFDEIASRFGSPAKHGDVKYGVNHPRLKGYFFTAEAAKQARVFIRMLEEVSTPNSKALQHFDHVLSKLKAALTIYMPGHHMTNLIGDVYYNWIAGVNKPIRYEQAMKVMLAQKGRYGDFATLEKLTGPKALEQAVARSLVKPNAGLQIPAAGNKVIVTMQNGTKVTADMIYTAAFREGILPSARVLEEVVTDTTNILDKWRPLGGRGQRGVHVVSEIRDHIPRLAQFIDGIAKSKGSFASAVTSSSRSVRKWHPDGLDLTKFERNFMKRVFPFYSWTRKAIPLAIEASIFAGPKVMAYPRLMEAIALSNGVSPSDRTRDPFPGDQMFPDWLRDRGIGPILGGPGNYTVVNPSTPILDTLALLGHPGQSSIDMLNPIMKVPIEAGQGQTLGRNVPIGTTNEEWLNYFAKQVPVVSQAGRASGQFGVSESTKSEGFPNYTNILNMLTGAKIVNTGKYQKSAQFDLRDYLKQKKDQQGR